MSEDKPKILPELSYKRMIENSVGTKMFNSLFIEGSDGNPKDVLNNGEFSCAFFVSSILVLGNLLAKPRATVNSLYDELSKSSDFIEISESDLDSGDIIFWEEIEFEDGSKNKHTGFYIGNKEAISMVYLKKEVARHHYKDFSSGKRKISSVFRIVWNKN